MMLRLNPSIPVEVVGRGTGECVGWIDYGPEAHLIWIVALDSNGHVWAVPNPDIRFVKNYTMGRMLEDKE